MTEHTSREREQELEKMADSYRLSEQGRPLALENDKYLTVQETNPRDYLD